MTAPRLLPSAALAAVVLLSLPSMALAQTKPRRPAATPAAPAPAPAPPPVAAVEPAAQPAASPFTAPIEENGPWRMTGLLGWEKDSDSDLSGPRLQVQLERNLAALGSRGTLSFVTTAGWFHGTDSKTVGIPLTTYTVTTDTTSDIFELVPAFRAGFALVPKLRIFGEVGVGGGYAMGKVEERSTATPGIVGKTNSDSFLGVLRLSLGATFALNERLRLGVELPTVSRRYGEHQSQTVSFSATAAYAF